MHYPDPAAFPFPGMPPLSTADLAARPSRAPRPDAERAALLLLTEAIAESRDGVLQRLAETALDLCDADSAGISIDEGDASPPVFRWRAVAGRLAPWLGGTMPRESSPCTIVLATGALQLMTDPARHYPCLDQLPPITEVLLVPVHDGDVAIGTLWVVDHDGRRRFDREDAKSLERLARFAASALRFSVGSA